LKKRYLNLIFALIGIVPLLTGSLATALALKNESYLRTFGIKNWFLLTFLLALSSAFALTPPTLVAIVYGYFLGWAALPWLVVLNLSAIASVYGLSKLLDAKSWIEYLSENTHVAVFLRNIHQKPWRFVMLAKLSPILPFALTNLLFGLLKLPFREVMAGGVAGMLPRTALAAWVGLQAQQLQEALQNPNADTTSQVIIAVLVVVSVWGLVSMLKRSK
jgi:uncharacterized membrane protein YdjX (TVP38/TMEM64 family)